MAEDESSTRPVASLRNATDADLDACISALAAEGGGTTTRDAIRKYGPKWLQARGIRATATALEKRFRAAEHAVWRRPLGRKPI
jgi:hypothetical protein